MKRTMQHNQRSRRRRHLIGRVRVIASPELVSKAEHRSDGGDYPFELEVVRASDLPDLAAGANPPEAVILAEASLTAEQMRTADELLIAMHAGPGAGGLDLELARRLGIFVASVPDGITELYVELFADAFDRLASQRAAAGYPMRRVGIVGLGQVGFAIAAVVAERGLQVWAHDPFVQPEQFRQAPARPAPLADLFGICDAISLQVPLGPATRHLVSTPLLELLPRNATLLNLAHPDLLDVPALVRFLGSRPGATFAQVSAFAERPLPVDLRDEFAALRDDARFQEIPSERLRTADAHGRYFDAALRTLSDFEWGLPLPHLLIDPPLPRTERFAQQN